MFNRHAGLVLLLILIALVGLGLLLWATRWGIGTSPDSIAYIKAARDFWAESVIVANPALIFRPPFYPMLLAAVSLVGMDPFITARWLNAILYAVNILLVGMIIRQYQPRSAWLAILGALLMLFANPLLEIHAYAWSEPLFILLGYLGLLLLANYVEHEKKGYLLLAAVLLGLALLTRYAGVAFLATAALSLLLLGRQSWGRRLGTAVLFGLVAVLPLLLWLARHIGSDRLAGGRAFVFHPAGRGHFWQAVYTFSDWLQAPLVSPGFLRVALLVGVAGAAVALLLHRFATPRRQHNVIPSIYKILLLLLPVYILFLLISISFLDAATPLDNRILSPLYPALVMLGLYALEELFQQSQRWRAIQVSLVLLLVIFVGMSAVRNGRWIWQASQNGLGFSSLAWQQAELIAQIKMLPTDTLIFSNLPDAVYFLAERPANPLPRKRDATTQQINNQYEADLARMGRRVSQEEGVVVYFFALRGNPALPLPQELTDTLLLHPLVETAEGIIFSSQ
jgi:4-amino-4-deoxy-L-arabinose transferase-like glycosyltransferase